MKVIAQLFRSITVATCAQLAGRLANVAISLLVIAMAGATAQTDEFFFILAVAFYFFGVLANALTQAGVPLIVSGELTMNGIHVTVCGAICAISISAAAFLVNWICMPISLPYQLALGLMAGAGIANGLACGAWLAEKRYIMPGLSWALRLMPLGVWRWVDPGGTSLAWLAVGIGLADSLRCLLLLKWRSPIKSRWVRLELPRGGLLAQAYGTVILAALIGGLNPIIDRIIAGFGGPGSVSILETGERVFMMLAGLTTIGMSTALLPILSRDVKDNTLNQNWPEVIKFVAAWNAAWFLAGWIAGAFGLKWWLHSATGLSTAQSAAAQWVYWYYLIGLPFFTLALAYLKRLQALQRWKVMVFTACISVALNIPTSLILLRIMGVAGIALATSLIHMLICAVLIFVAQRQKHLNPKVA